METFGYLEFMEFLEWMELSEMGRDQRNSLGNEDNCVY